MREKRSSPRLSRRLEMAARIISPCGTVADVGCDHAHLCICLVLEGSAQRAIAMDVREGPIGHARENISLYNCSQMIETRLSDGLDALAAGEAETVVMTGMGGVLMTELLNRGRDRLEGVRELVLSPQSHQELVRSFLPELGFAIEEEDVCIDGGKYYTVIRAVSDGQGKACEPCGNPGREDGQGMTCEFRGSPGGEDGQGKMCEFSGDRGKTTGPGMPGDLREFVRKLSERTGREDDGAVQIDAILAKECSLEEEARLRYGDAALYKGKDLYLDLLLYEKKKAERVLESLKSSGAEPGDREQKRFSRRLEVLDCAVRSYEALKISDGETGHLHE